jgi:hypothetical protein
MANKAFINTDLWKDDAFLDLSVDAKFVYLGLLIAERDYIDVFVLHRKILGLISGFSDHQIDIGIKSLESAGFIEVYNGYIGIKKSYAVKLGGFYNEINSKREYERLPDEIREHFYPDGEEVVITVKPAKVKTGPKAETVKDIIKKQPELLQEALNDFVEDRKERKKTATSRAVKGWVKKLQEMYPDDYANQARSINQSIEKGWSGLFEVKQTEGERKFM